MEYGFSLGSNLGDRLAHLSRARRQLAAVPGTRVLAASPVYETEPVGVKPEHQHLRFLNAVLVIESARTAQEWLGLAHRIESGMDRNRSADRYAPRTVDIDILYAGQQSMDSGGVTIPHPRWAGRRFVVQPLAEVRPDLVLPGVAMTVREICDTLPPDPAFRLFARDW